MPICNPADYALIFDFALLYLRLERARARGEQSLVITALQGDYNRARLTHKQLLESEDAKALMRLIIQRIQPLQDAERENGFLQKRISTLEAVVQKHEIANVNVDAARAHYYYLLDREEKTKAENADFRVKIQYDGYLTRHELSAILKTLDKVVEQEFLRMWLAGMDDSLLRKEVKKFVRLPRNRTFIGICSVERGSVDILVHASTAIFEATTNHPIISVVAGYIGTNLVSGIKQSELANQIRRLGKLTAQGLANVIEKFNDWLEKKFLLQNEKGKGRITKVKATLPEKID